MITQKGLTEPKSGLEPRSEKNVPQSRRISSATSKIVKNDPKILSSNSNPWNQNDNSSMKANHIKASPSRGSLKSNIQSPRQQQDSRNFDPKKKSSQVQKGINNKPNKNEPRKQSNEFDKTGFSESSDKFNTTGKIFNQRYDPINRSGDHDFNQWQMVDEIEENLEYEIASNASGMNGTRGFSDFKDKKMKDDQDYIVDTEPRAGRDISLKNPKREINAGHKVSQSPKRQPLKRDDSEEKETMGYQYGKARDIYEMLSHSPELEDSLNSPTFNAKSGLNSNHAHNNIEEKKKIDALENQVQNMVSKLRPYSPPYSFATGSDTAKATVVTRKNDEVIVVTKENSEGVKENKESTNNDMLEVIYDPVWNCYYHPKTNTYYEMKE